VKIFLSHAKADGTEPAKRIRDYIYSQTQIAAFLTRMTFPSVPVRQGSGWQRRWQRSCSGFDCGTQCRLCRSPLVPPGTLPVPAASPGEVRGRRNQFWMLNPVLVVDALSDGDETVCIPEFGNVPTIRWSSAIPFRRKRS
jgi:hypothetical protein